MKKINHSLAKEELEKLFDIIDRTDSETQWIGTKFVEFFKHIIIRIKSNSKIITTSSTIIAPIVYFNSILLSGIDGEITFRKNGTTSILIEKIKLIDPTTTTTTTTTVKKINDPSNHNRTNSY